MPRKKKRRTFFRPRPQQRVEDAAEKRHRLQSAARVLLTTVPAEHLPRELAEREWLLGEADRTAQLEPSSVNLSRYRFAQTQYDIARVAVELGADARSDDPGRA